MWNKIRLLTSDSDTAVTKEYFLSDMGVASFTAPDSGAVLKSVKIYGAPEDIYEQEDGGLGYTADDGSTHLTVRVHGKNFMDGYELARLMKQCGSPAYGGEYDDEHFIYLTSAEECQMVSVNNLFIPPKIHTFAASFLLDEDIRNGGKLTPGIYFELHGRQAMPAVAATSGVGEVEASMNTPFGYLFKGISHKPLGINKALPIRYDSVCLTLGTKASYEPYDGESVDFNIGTPLYSNFYGDLCDELDCVSGILTRNIIAINIDESVVLTEVNYEGYPCLSMPLPERAGAFDASMDEFGWASSIDDFEFGDWLIFIGPDMEHLYIYFMDGLSPEEAKSIIVGRRLTYTRAVPEVIDLGQKIQAKLGGGLRYVEVCSMQRPTVEIQYLAKE